MAKQKEVLGKDLTGKDITGEDQNDLTPENKIDPNVGKPPTKPRKVKKEYLLIREFPKHIFNIKGAQVQMENEYCIENGLKEFKGKLITKKVKDSNNIRCYLVAK